MFFACTVYENWLIAASILIFFVEVALCSLSVIHYYWYYLPVLLQMSKHWSKHEKVKSHFFQKVEYYTKQ